MNADHRIKIEATATEFLKGFNPLSMPFATIEKFIARLKADPSWTDAEIIELQTRVIREILARQGDLG